MMKYGIKKIHKAFTMSEAILTMVILGVIFALSITALKFIKPAQDGMDTMSKKMAENLDQAFTQIIAHHAGIDDLLIIKNGNDRFSIADEDVTPKMAKVIGKYILEIPYDLDLTNEYFSEQIKDYNKKPTGETLKDAYSHFVVVQDGIFMGLRFYGNCTTTEPNATPPMQRGRLAMPNTCGSIFYDVNGFKKPNKLGSDQYVLPLYRRGIKYSEDDI